MKCPKCNTEFEGDKCPNCAEETVKKASVKKPIYKKVWFWIVVSVAAILIIGAFSSSEEPAEGTDASETKSTSESVSNTPTKETGTSQKYENIGINTLISDLKNNALSAKSNYEGKYVQFNARIASIDNNGAYITVKRMSDEYALDTITCYLEKEHIDFLLQKKVGDKVCIKGKITDVKDIFGYYMDIDYLSEHDSSIK